MNGTIKTYLPEKKYGFIKGDDGKDYFFHTKYFKNNSQVKHLYEDAIIRFEQKSSPKGYQAYDCELISPDTITTYQLPPEVLTSKTDKIKGWDIIELGHWRVYGESSDSPEAAKKEIKNHAKELIANAVLNLEYFKTTGSSGNYNYTVHNYKGQVAVIAKKSLKGQTVKEKLFGLNNAASRLKTEQIRTIDVAQKKVAVIMVIFVILALITVYLGSGKGDTIALVVLFIGFISASSVDTRRIKWLEKIN